DLALPGYTALERPVAAEPFEARLEAEVPSFPFLRAATDRYDSLAGSISLSASAGGRIATPNLEAELRIDSLYARSMTGTETRASLLGTLSAAVADDSTLSGLLRLTPGNVRFAYVEGGVFEEIRLNPTELEVRAGPDGVRGALDLAIADTMGAVLGTFGGRFALPDYRRYGQPIADAGLEATFQGEVQDLAFAEAFSPEVDSLAGSLALDVRMTGTVGDPDWAGGFRLSDGAMRLPLLGALYHDIQLAATGTEAGDIRVEGGAESGAGEVTVNGTTPVRPTADQPGRFEIRGN